MTTSPTRLRFIVPARVTEPRGAIAAAELMVQLLRGIASVTATVLASTRGRVAAAPVPVLHD